MHTLVGNIESVRILLLVDVASKILTTSHRALGKLSGRALSVRAAHVVTGSVATLTDGTETLQEASSALRVCSQRAYEASEAATVLTTLTAQCEVIYLLVLTLRQKPISKANMVLYGSKARSLSCSTGATADHTEVTTEFHVGCHVIRTSFISGLIHLDCHR